MLAQTLRQRNAVIDQLKMEQLREQILSSQRSPVKSIPTSALAHFHEFSDIDSDEDNKSEPGINQAPKKNMKKPQVKIDISSIDSIETFERMTAID